MARRRRTNKPAPQYLDTDTSRIKIAYKPLSSITPYERNPRDNEQAVDATIASISTFGFLVPIVVDSEGVIAAGHTRYKAATKMGLKTVPVVTASHLTDEQLAAFRVVDNKVAELADWNDMLSVEITALQGAGFDFTQFGWTQEEVDCLTDMVQDDCLSVGAAAQMNQRRTEDDEKDTRRAPARTRFVLGDIVFFVDQSSAKMWLSDVRAETDFEENRLIEHIKELLGITDYESGV